MPRKPDNRMRPVGVALPPDLIRRMDKHLKGRDESRSSFIRRCVREHLDEAESFDVLFSDPKLRSTFFGALSERNVLAAMLEAMGAKVDDSQLKLFERGLKQIAEAT